nr:nitrate/nitrite transporter [Phaeacidiphilus oryzae]
MTDWRPEDEGFWRAFGARIARRNLIQSVFCEHIGFSVWSLWSVLVLFLGPAYHIDPAGKFVLTALPNALGAVLRVPYTFAVARFGGRNWTIVSALLLLLPTLLAAAVLRPGVSYGLLLVVACTAGVGGGNFASSMANINAFYPDRHKGRALGLNAGGGNVGVAVVQLVGLAVLATAGAGHPRVLLAVYVPLIVLAALGAALRMDNLAPGTTAVSRDLARHAMRDVCREPHTWVISALYVGTFGSFIGFGFAFGQVLQVQFHGQFGTPVRAAELTFLGPLLGSLIRPVGGWLADRFGGAVVTLWTFVAMAAATGVILVASAEHSLPLFIAAFTVLFALTGVGNGATYKMIPSVFRRKYPDAPGEARRRSTALIGLAAAIGAFGGVLVNLAFRASFQSGDQGRSAYLAFLAAYAVCAVLTATVYLRRGAATRIAGKAV